MTDFDKDAFEQFCMKTWDTLKDDPIAFGRAIRDLLQGSAEPVGWVRPDELRHVGKTGCFLCRVAGYQYMADYIPIFLHPNLPPAEGIATEDDWTDAMEHIAMQEELGRLRKEVANWKLAWQEATDREIQLRAQLADLREKALDAAERMERARAILSKDGNWGMLDTAALRQILEG